MVTDPIYQLPMSVAQQKNLNLKNIHHVEGYQDLPTWAREKGGVKTSTNFRTPCTLNQTSGMNFQAQASAKLEQAADVHNRWRGIITIFTVGEAVRW